MMPKTVDRKMVRSWSEELEAVGDRLSDHFARSEVRQRAQDYLRGLLSEAERKNSLHLADAESALESCLIVDETGFIKKGEGSVGVKRQYTGTVGKRENCQVGVFLAYASGRGQAFIDREVYLPEEWALDKERRQRAGVPEEVGMRTKPELAKVMLGRALEAGVKAAWVVADSVYGDSRRLGMFLEEREQPYVLAVSGKAYVWAGLRQHRVGEVLEALGRGELLPEEGFKRISVGDGSKGPRLYDWLRLPLNPPMQEGFQRWLVVRRSIEDPEELSAYTVFAPEGSTLEALAKAAGSRWRGGRRFFGG